MTGYFSELKDTFLNDFWNILGTSILLWILFPTILFAVCGILLLLNIVGVELFVSSFANAIIPWWASIILSFKKFVLELIGSIIVTSFLVHHEILESITFKDLIKYLKRS